MMNFVIYRTTLKSVTCGFELFGLRYFKASFQRADVKHFLEN